MTAETAVSSPSFSSMAASRLVVPSQRRGRTEAGWLTSYHSFSFGDFIDPSLMGFGAIRVINDDVIAGGGGFPTHPHRDMEIVTLVFSGALAHRDSLGNGTTIAAGDVQRMSAGSGIRHSEFNASASAPAHLFQIWILPRTKGRPPSYAQRSYAPGDIHGRWKLVGSGDGREGSVDYDQDIDLYRADLDAGGTLAFAPAPGRMQWLHVARGAVRVEGTLLQAGDALASVNGSVPLAVTADAASALILFDQPAP